MNSTTTEMDIPQRLGFVGKSMGRVNLFLTPMFMQRSDTWAFVHDDFSRWLDYSNHYIEFREILDPTDGCAV